MKTPQKPMPNLAKALGLKNEVWFKFENKHHLGSHKGRSIPRMIEEYLEKKVTSFVISSSGNAALAALLTVVAHNKNKPTSTLSLKIYVGEGVTKDKLLTLQSKQDSCISIEQVKNPKQSALNFSKESGATWLRGSTDPLALIGYRSLSEELLKIENLSAVFLAASSGTAAEGIMSGFNAAHTNPELHIVQTDSCHPIINYLLENQNQTVPKVSLNNSLADAIIDKVGHRKESVTKAIINSNGAGWIASDAQINEAIELVKKETGEKISPNSALSVVGLKEAVLSGRKWKGPVACIIGGD
ncbi:MAG: PLP-dependent lyase/thiolase [Patescibacteria group bacterium]|jgi:threonine dehydratase